jgi:hypothetical protein
MKYIIVVLAFTGDRVIYYPTPGYYKSYKECYQVLEKQFNPYRDYCYLDIRPQ